jgi:Gram-negative bacterial TonB protein C-terminal
VRELLRVLCCGGMLLLAHAASIAQVQSQPLASDASRCLDRVPAAPAMPLYPDEALARGESGRVLVNLHFVQAGTEPQVSVIERTGAESFVDAVRAFASHYRVPCLGAGQTADLRQDFRFKPADKQPVYWNRPADADDSRVRRAIACAVLPPATDYPARALREGQFGNVVVKLRFDGPTTAPVVAVMERPDSDALVASTLRRAEAIRVPCHDGQPVEWLITYSYRFNGVEPARFNDLRLGQLLGASKDIDKAQVYFDTNTMSCPFDVRIVHLQPHSANRVGEIGERDPERRFFLDWLTRLQIVLKPRAHNLLYGEAVNVHVPCTVIQLGTMTGGGASY